MNIFSKEMLMAGGEKVFVRPNLTSNGSSGDYFYVTASVDTSNAYRAVNGNSSNYWTCSGSNVEYLFSCKNELNVTELKITDTRRSVMIVGVYGRNSGGWNSITSTSSTSGNVITLSLSNTNYWKNYKIAFYGNGRITDIDITATEKG